MDVINAMAAVLGDTIIVWFLFASLSVAAGLYGWLTGRYQAFDLTSGVTTFLFVGIISATVGARFDDTGHPVLIGLITAVFMVAGFILGAVVSLSSNQTVPQDGLITANNDEPVNLDVLWETPPWYDHEGNQPYR